MSKRSEYSPEFKQEAVMLIKTLGVTIAQIVPNAGYWRDVDHLETTMHQVMAGFSHNGSE